MSRYWDAKEARDRLHTAKTIYEHSDETDMGIIGILRELKQ